MKSLPLIKVLFVIAALYDGVLGVLFLLLPRMPFDWFAVTPPNHMGYVRFPAALLLIFALMFLAVAVDPVRRRELIVYGMLLKISYCALAFYYWAVGGLPGMYKPFAIIDVVFLVLFVWAFVALGTASTTPAAAQSPQSSQPS